MYRLEHSIGRAEHGQQSVSVHRQTWPDLYIAIGEPSSVAHHCSSTGRQSQRASAASVTANVRFGSAHSVPDYSD